MNNAEEPAFPEPYLNDPHLALSTKPGLTKREYFAAMAMQGLIQTKGSSTYDLTRNREGVATDIAEASIKLADELLKELETLKQ